MDDRTEYLDALVSAEANDALWKLHCERMAYYGFDRVIYGYTSYIAGRSFGDPLDWIVRANFEGPYFEGYLNRGLYTQCPMMKWAIENDGCCSWGSIHAQYDSLTDGEKEVIDFDREHGLTAGYSLSFPSKKQRSKGGMALIAKPGLNDDDVDAIWAEHGGDILLGCKIVHLKIMTLPHNYNRAKELSRRQREILEWVGMGKTGVEIALILGITPTTVEKHMREARAILDTTSTAHTVAKATLANQIFVDDL